jgi:hypothetical protein
MEKKKWIAEVLYFEANICKNEGCSNDAYDDAYDDYYDKDDDDYDDQKFFA